MVTIASWVGGRSKEEHTDTYCMQGLVWQNYLRRLWECACRVYFMWDSVQTTIMGVWILQLPWARGLLGFQVKPICSYMVFKDITPINVHVCIVHAYIDTYFYIQCIYALDWIVTILGGFQKQLETATGKGAVDWRITLLLRSGWKSEVAESKHGNSDGEDWLCLKV